MVANGIEELNLQPLDPIRLDYSHKQNLGPVNFRVEAKNMSIHHLTTFTKLEFHSNTKKRTLRFEYAVPKISVDANYVLSGRAFFFPLIGSGPAHIDIRMFIYAFELILNDTSVWGFLAEWLDMCTDIFLG